MRTHTLGARAFIIPFALAGAVLFSLAPSTPAAASASTTEAQQIIRIAKAQLGDPWRYGTAGPSTFDCSGLVRYAFRRAGDAAMADEELAALTTREREILDLVAGGASNQEIAEKLFISEKTVRNHLTAIFDKIGVSSRSQAIVFARDRGLAGRPH